MNTIRIRAVGGDLVPFRDETGRVHPGRFFGMSGGKILPDGEEVPDTQPVRKAISRGALVIIEASAVVAKAAAPRAVGPLTDTPKESR